MLPHTDFFSSPSFKFSSNHADKPFCASPGSGSGLGAPIALLIGGVLLFKWRDISQGALLLCIVGGYFSLPLALTTICLKISLQFRPSHVLPMAPERRKFIKGVTEKMPLWRTWLEFWILGQEGQPQPVNATLSEGSPYSSITLVPRPRIFALGPAPRQQDYAHLRHNNSAVNRRSSRQRAQRYT